MKKTLITAALLAIAIPATAQAHATLEKQEAHVGGGYKAVFRVPHGCSGKPTIAVRVQIPEGVIGAKPMPKAGWTLEKIKGPYEKTYDYYHSKVSEGLKEVVWSGGSLADDEYDEFVISTYLTDGLPVGKTLYFPIVQECPDGATARWIEIPAEGEDADSLEHPAPGVMLKEKGHGH